MVGRTATRGVVHVQHVRCDEEAVVHQSSTQNGRST
jgi:hypothetical protein